MKIKQFFTDVFDAINDHERDFSERVFLLYTLISELTVFIAFVADIITRENIGELVVIGATLVLVPTITFTSLYKNRIRIAIRIIVAGLVFLILPGLFFFGGGVEGGGVLWIIFAFMYIGLVISGIWRKILLAILFILTVIFYLVQYNYPELVPSHTRGMFYIDQFLSIILVGMVCFTMTWFQNRLFTDENERAKKEAERAEELTRSQNRFFSSMSHEIRTPINSILGLNELILRDTTASDEIIRDSSGIQGAGKMLLSLINDILDFSKIEAGSMEIVPVDYNVGDMFSDIVNMVWLTAHDKGLRFDISIDPKVPSVLYGDEVRIKQIMINLLNNAVKYTNEGYVELHVECEEAEDDAVMLSVSVSDTGMGIRKESLPYLFDAFKRVDEEKNRYIEGTGLGLSIVKLLVDLMGGTLTVNSVYGEGSTFNVVLRQGVSDRTQIGELNIHNQQTIRRTAYESSFKAPDAAVLIVDDNEMNLEVECKLLADTGMRIDRAENGREALSMTLKMHYDAILMDHLMPEMDGIECLEQIRQQSGGLNRATPVIVLTANAGTDNRELYNRAGFDGYLVKPVSGDLLEEMMIRHIDADKLILGSRMMSMREDINTSSGYSGKSPVVITSCSMCDLPSSLIKRFGIPIIPFGIKTEEGEFKDGEQIGANELMRYINTGKSAVSVPPDEAAYTEFFSEVLKKTHHIIHISITTSVSEDYKNAFEASKSFDNVTVINSESISSATGILVLIAYKLAQQNMPVEAIASELETVRKRLRCSYIVDNTMYLARRGIISERSDRFARSLNLHPCIRIKDDRFTLGGLWAGSSKHAYRRFIGSAFPVDIIPDPDVVFITYADVPYRTLEWIKEEISKYAYFENVVFKQASAGLSSNSGPGSFGILYFVKGNKSYNISSLVESVSDYSDNETDNDDDGSYVSYDETAGSGATEWYKNIEGIDGNAAITNSGSEEALKTVLKIFADSIQAKSEEIGKYYVNDDWKNYVIKIHALKSSARLIGATELAQEAQKLESAGKDGDIGYIKENHSGFMDRYAKYSEYLAGFFEQDKNKKPVADDNLMNSVYDALKEAATAMDCDALEGIIKELDDYTIPDSDIDKYSALCEKADNYDYDGILEMLGDRA